MKTKINISLFFAYSFVLSNVIVDQLHLSTIWNYSISFLVAFVGTLIFKAKIKDFSLNKSLLIFTFLIFIFLPLVGKKETTSLENRTLAPMPEWRWSNIWKFFFQYQSYFEDRFAYRNEMIAGINRIKINIFHKSAMSDLVAIGDNGWFFMAKKDYIMATSAIYTEAQLDTIVFNLELVTKYFASKNIKYYFMMLPVKARIYPEHMLSLQLLEMTNSKMDQIYERLKKNQIIKSIDCKQELIDGKKVRDTYYQTDTHWNMFGAFLGYKKLMPLLQSDFPNLTAYNENDFVVDSIMLYDGNLQKMLGFTNMFQMKHFSYKFKNSNEPITITLNILDYPNAQFTESQMPHSGNNLKLFLVRDSFSELLKIFLVPTFNTSVLAWTPNIPVTAVLQESPDLVVHEMLELFSDNLLKLPPEILADQDFINEYMRNRNK